MEESNNVARTQKVCLALYFDFCSFLQHSMILKRQSGLDRPPSGRDFVCQRGAFERRLRVNSVQQGVAGM